MKPDQYRPIIKKTLEDAKGGSFASIDKLCDHLVHQMDLYEQMVGLAAELNVTPPVAAPVTVPVLSEKTDEPVDAPRLVPLDVSLRIGAKARWPDGSIKDENERIREYRTKQELYDYYKANLPAKFEVTPPGFTEPLALHLTMMMSPDPATAIKIKYAPIGSTNDAMSSIDIVSTTDRDMDPERVLASIKTQAEGIFRPTVKEVVARRPPPKESLFSGGGENALSASVGPQEYASDGDIQHWNKYAGRPQINRS